MFLLNMARKSTAKSLLNNSPVLPSLKDKITFFRHQTWPELPLNRTRFVVFDTETTGFNYKKGDEIISLGAIAVENGCITESCFSQLVNPNRNIPAIATEITGITNEMVADCPNVLTVLDEFLEFKGLSPLVAHNASFDLNFVNHKLRKYCGHRLSTPTIDTFLLSQVLFPYEENLRTLDSLAQHFCIPLVGRHTALGDAIITAKIFTIMVDSLKKIGIETTYQLASYLHFKRLIL